MEALTIFPNNWVKSFALLYHKTENMCKRNYVYGFQRFFVFVSIVVVTNLYFFKDHDLDAVLQKVL